MTRRSTLSLDLLDYSKFRAVIFDVDGTLYNQRSLRSKMALEMLTFLIFKPTSLREIIIVREFRKLREKFSEREEASLLEAQYRWVSVSLNIDYYIVKRVVDNWILVRPLKHLLSCRPPGVFELFERIKTKKIKLGVFSDHPPKEKLAALNLEADLSACALDAEINRFKPSPAGLLHLCDKFGVVPSEALHIGDREDRDQLAARSCGVHSIILPASKAKRLGREQTYDLIFPN